jgi:transposase-like protein
MVRPPFCPNRECSAHYRKPAGRWWVHRGFYHTRLNGPVPRFGCRLCGAGFSAQTFSIDYYAKRRVDYHRLIGLQSSCAGVRQIARQLGVSCGTVENKTMRFARQALSAHIELTERLRLAEDVCADGLQSYWVSQYVPNNITVLAGSESRFLYHWNGASLRRGGAMRPAQRRRRTALERRFRADPDALTHCFTDICEQLCRLIGRSPRAAALTRLDTDRHGAYRRALGAHGPWQLLLAAGRVAHRRTSSRARRSAANPLAPVNTIDRQIRIDLAEHVRETVRFARNPNHTMERFTVWAWAYNYRKRYLINQPLGDTTTHAQAAGLDAARIAAVSGDLTRRRRFLSHTPLVGQFRRIWLRMMERPFQSGQEYLPRYLLA